MDEDWDNEDSGAVPAKSSHTSRDNRHDDRYGNQDDNRYAKRHDDGYSHSERRDRSNGDRHRSDNRSQYRSDDNDRHSKRYSEHDDRRSGYGANGREENGEHITVDIDYNMAGKVIGSGGSQVRELQDRFRVKIQVDKDSRENSARVVIRGDARDMEEAKLFIEDLVSNRSSGQNYRSDNDSRSGQRSHNSDDRGGSRGSDSSQLEFDPSKVGMVIGRGGSKIKELQQKFNVHLNIDRNPNHNGQATVTIQGNNPSSVQDALAEIRELVGEQSSNGGNGWNAPPETAAPPPTAEDDNFVAIDWQAAAKESEVLNLQKWAKLPPILKNFYKEKPEVAGMSASKVAYIREQNNNTAVDRMVADESIQNDPIPNPVEKFDQCFEDYPDLLHEIVKQGFTAPSPIQAQAWPVLLKGEDLIGIAQTGTGKTLAFLLPAMIHTENQTVPRGQRGGPNVLVLAPTRELAQQIEREVAKYQFRGMKAVCIYGGGDRKAQISTVEGGVEIVIATPGRLNDLVEAKIIDVTTITYLVLDEADRMLDMGFEPQIRKFLLDIRPDRQTVMTSATWPSAVRRLAERYMKNPIQVCIGTLDLAAVHSVEQIIEIIDEESKFSKIMEFAHNMTKTDKAIIFCGKKARADDLSSEISLKGIPVQCIHGDRDQSDREQALIDIKEGVVNILIATDVASRGIDIEDISYVVNYDFPRNIEEYVHRVGRTGRAGKTGTSISFFTRGDWGSSEELIKILEEANQGVPDELREMKKRFDNMKERRDRERSNFGGGGGGGGGGRRFGGGGGRDGGNSYGSRDSGGYGGRSGGGGRSKW